MEWVFSLIFDRSLNLCTSQVFLLFFFFKWGLYLSSVCLTNSPRHMQISLACFYYLIKMDPAYSMDIFGGFQNIMLGECASQQERW